MLRLGSNSVFFAIILISLCALILPAMGQNASADTGWWDNAWSRRAPVVITETSGSTLTSYQVKIVVPYDSDMQSDFDDVRFLDNAGANQLYYWRENYTTSSTATFWVKVPSIPASGIQTIWMYYGNPGVSTTSDIHNTFIFGDDFENATWTSAHINMADLEGGDSRQTVVNGTYNFKGTYVKPPDPADGNASHSESIAEIGPGGQGNGGNNTLTPFPANYVVEANVETLTDNSGGNQTGAAFICPRYRNVSWKYETVLDLAYPNSILNKVVDDQWTQLGVRYLGYQVEAGTWYNLKAVVLQEGSTGNTTNRLQVFANGEMYIDETDSALLYDHQYTGINIPEDVNITPNGLGFIGYDFDQAFHVVYDNFRVRQYASQEPTTWIGAEEHVTGVIPSWWDSSWSRRAPIVITETSGSTLTDYQVQVVVPYDSEMQPDFDDVRFVGNNGANELHYWRESKTDGSTATFWVKVPQIPASGNTTIQMYYGNPSISTTSDIHNTFIWGDDFENATWTGINLHSLNSGTSTQYVDSGQYYMQGNAGDRPIAEIYELGSLKQFPANYIAEADINPAILTGEAFIAPRYHTTYGMYEDALGIQYSYVAVYKVVSGVWASLASSYLPYGYIEAGTWYSLKAVTLQEGSTNRLQVFVNDVKYIDQNDPDLSYNGLALLASDLNFAFQVAFDNFRVRQYAFQEPVTTLGLEEGAEPTVTTEAASAITTNSATLNGNLTSLGAATSVQVSFVWGTAHGGPYPSETAATPPTMTATGTFSASLSGILLPGTTYYFEAKANGGANGTNYGGEGNFTTTTVAPSVSTNAATGVTTNSATLNGNLTSLGTATSVDVSFEYATDAYYTGNGSSYSVETSPQSMSAIGPFSANLASLAPDITYHYRAKAVGNGASYGDDVTFTTAQNLYQIKGVTGEVNCAILPAASVDLYSGAALVGSTTSDSNGNYTLTAPESGIYQIVVSKSGFRGNGTQEISITASGEYTLDFTGETGLVPNAPDMSYALACVNHWLYPTPPCGLEMSKVLEVVNAWLYPLQP